MSRRALAVLSAAPALLVLLAAAPLAAAPAAKTVEKTLAATGTIRIANLAGTVDLVPAGPGPIRIVAQVTAEGRSSTQTHELMEAMHWVQERDGTWNLAYPVDRYDAFVYPSGLKSMGSSNSVRFRGQRVHVYGGARGDAPLLYADLTIAIPQGATVEIREGVGPVRGNTLSANLTVDTGSGIVTLNHVAGRLAVDTGSGDVNLREIAGDTKVDTGSGDVNIDGISATALRLDTGSGDVTVHRGTLGDVVAKTGSGDVEIKDSKLMSLVGDTGSGEITVSGDLSQATKIALDTGSGEVHVYGGPAFEFDLTTDIGSGSVNVGYADAELRREDHEIVGARRGSGQTRVSVDTGSGDVTIAPSR